MSVNLRLCVALLAACVTVASLSLPVVADANSGPHQQKAATAAAPQATVALTPLPGTPALQNQSTSQFQFIVCGDCRPADSGQPPSNQLGYIVNAALTSKPAFILSSGDTIYGHNPNSANQIAGEYNAFLQIMAKAKVPVFDCPGNHEMGDANDRPNATMLSWYSKMMCAATYGSFVYGNSTFIALNTEEIPPAGLPVTGPTDDGTLSLGYVSAQQLAWLKTTLDQNKTQDNVFIFMHHPIHCIDKTIQLRASSAAAIVALVQNYPNVAYIIAAHMHGYCNPQNPSNFTTPSQRTNGGPPLYVVSGGAGGLVASGPGGFNNYLVFSVNGKTVNVQLVREP